MIVSVNIMGVYSIYTSADGKINGSYSTSQTVFVLFSVLLPLNASLNFCLYTFSVTLVMFHLPYINFL